MIHEVDERIFALPLHQYILTFDDGLYSQYYYFDKFKKIDTLKYFFISTGFIAGSTQSLNFLDSHKAHKKAATGNYEDFMTVEQIKELTTDPQVIIGGHGHNHYDLNTLSSLPKKVECIANDTEQMLNWFTTKLGSKPTAFCYPHNNDCNGIYTIKLRSLGFNEFFGRERIPVETLLDSVSLKD